MYRVTLFCLNSLVDFDLKLENYIRQYAKDFPGVELVSMCTGLEPNTFVITWKAK